VSHTEQDLFYRWIVGPDVGLEALRRTLGDTAELLGGGRSSRGVIDVDYHWEFRSQRPLVGAEEALSRGSQLVEAIWIRARSGFSLSPSSSDEEQESDDDVDGINQVDRECDRLMVDMWRPCRYGFDEIAIYGAQDAIPGFTVDGPVRRWRGQGSYLTRNCNATFLRQFAPVPGPTLSRAEPIDALVVIGNSVFTRIEWRWRGRVVHTVTHREGDGPYRDPMMQQHEANDGWDNCIDDVFLERAGDLALLRPASVYFRDRYPVG
jgi:hypothetical protein